ncbi:MAG: hypothetical protein JWM40_2938 [Frankiales bacterium]|nr:hypothetical protein [Frankiales bacterium]
MTSQTEVSLLVLGIGMSFVVAALAERKGYNKQIWGFYGLLLWPVALLMIAVKPLNPSLFRRCPDCGATDVSFDAPVCKHCGRDERRAATS